ncbi:MAG: hypothetical protein GY934_24235 [Gammaproteobacteria bacterium]|nr:hypothetical protein [Gammaproteobacteria bacterium]
MARFRYLYLGKAGDGLMLRYLEQVSSYSRQTVTRLVAEYQYEVRLAKVEVDDNVKLAGHYKLRGFPTVVMFSQGKNWDVSAVHALWIRYTTGLMSTPDSYSTDVENPPCSRWRQGGCQNGLLDIASGASRPSRRVVQS